MALKLLWAEAAYRNSKKVRNISCLSLLLPGGMARLAAGPSGLFRITSDESLEGMNNGKDRVPVEIAVRFSKSLSRLKQATNAEVQRSR